MAALLDADKFVDEIAFMSTARRLRLPVSPIVEEVLSTEAIRSRYLIGSKVLDADGQSVRFLDGSIARRHEIADSIFRWEVVRG